MPQYLGKVIVRMNGEALNSAKGAKISLGGVKRTPVKTSSGVGYSEEMQEAVIECEIPLEAGKSIEAIRNAVGVTATFEGDTGHCWVIGDAFVADALDVVGGEGGKIKVKLIGSPADSVA